MKGVPGNDDFAAMEEVLTRRFTNYLEDRDKPVAERGKFQYPPQLLVVDGGKGQLERGGAGAGRARPGGGDPGGLARQAVRGGLPARAGPTRSQVPRRSEALFLLQRIRDESHRFAITFHRELRGKRMTTVGARRHPRPGREAQEAAGQGAGRRARGEGGRARDAAGPAVAARRGGDAVYEELHGR